MKKPARRIKRYDAGGPVYGTGSEQDPGPVKPGGGGGSVMDRTMSAVKTGMMASKLASQYGGGLGGSSSSGSQSPTEGTDLGGLYKKGGKITRVAGKPIGKEDGLIAAQKGEYVIRKSAAKKLGTGVLNTINRGKLPKAKGR